MTTLPKEPPLDLSAATDDEVAEYIDYLHDRLQFLEEELRNAEQTVLELQQDGACDEAAADQPSAESSQIEADIQTIAEYVRFLGRDFGQENEQVKTIAGDIVAALDEHIETTDDLHNASLALWFVLRKHEKMATDQ